VIREVDPIELALKTWRAASPMNEYIYKQITELKKRLEPLLKADPKHPTGKPKGWIIDFQDRPNGKYELRSLLYRFRRLANEYIIENNLQLRITGGKEGNRDVMHITPGPRRKPRTAKPKASNLRRKA
jgi:hypothetical protein